MAKMHCLFVLVVILISVNASPFSNVKLGLQRFVSKVTGSNNQKRTDGELKSGIAKLYDDVSFIMHHLMLFIFCILNLVLFQLPTVYWHLA